MKKLLIVTNKEIPLTDYRTSLSELSDFNVTFLMPKSKIEYIGIEKVEVPLAGGFNLLNDLKGYYKLYKYLLFNKYDIVHFYNSKYYIIGPLLLFFTRNKTAIITINGFGRVFSSNSKKYILLRPILIFLLNISMFLSKKVTVQNNDDYAFLKKICFKQLYNKVSILKSATRSVDTNKKRFFENKNLRIISIGRVMKDKGINEFLEIASNVKRKNNAIEFTLIGDSTGDEVLDKKVFISNEKKIINHIESTKNVINYLSENDLMLFLSYREGMPRVILESMSVGLPVIAYDTIGVREVVKRNVNGLLFNLYDIEEITNKILEINNDQSVLKQFSTNAYNLFLEEFTFDRYLENIKDIYK